MDTSDHTPKHDPRAPTETWLREHAEFIQHCLDTIPDRRVVQGYYGFPVLYVEDLDSEPVDPGYFVGEFFWSTARANAVQQLAGFLADRANPPGGWIAQNQEALRASWKTTIDTLALTQIMLVAAPELMERAMRWALSHCTLTLPPAAMTALVEIGQAPCASIVAPEAVRRIRQGRRYLSVVQTAVVMTAVRQGIYREQPEAPSADVVLDRGREIAQASRTL